MRNEIIFFKKMNLMMELKKEETEELRIWRIDFSTLKEIKIVHASFQRKIKEKRMENLIDKRDKFWHIKPT